MKQEFAHSDNSIVGRQPFHPVKYKLAGVDNSGAHHILVTHLDDDYRTHKEIVVIDGQEGITQRIDFDAEEHSQLDVADWRDYIDQKRGWDVYFLEHLDLMSTVAGEMDPETTRGGA